MSISMSLGGGLRRAVLLSPAFLLTLLLLLSNLRRFSRAQELEGFEDEVDEDDDAHDHPESTAFSTAGRLSPSSSSASSASSSSHTGPQKSKKEGVWDEDEFEGFADEGKSSPGKVGAQRGSNPGREAGSSDARDGRSQGKQQRKVSIFKRQQEHYYFEMLAGLILVLYGVNVFLGRRENEAIALAWAQAFVSEGGVLERNFSLLGGGDGEDGDVMMKESQSSFKFYASGRRFCQGLMANMELKARQDLMSVLTNLVLPGDDCLDIDVYMNPTSMPSMVLACATHKLSRTLMKDHEDLKTFTKQIPVKQIQNWPGDHLVVNTESSEVFYDILTPEIRALFVGDTFEDVTKKYFRYFYFSSEHKPSSHAHVLKFSFALPPADRMEEDLGKLMAIIPAFIDIVGTYKLSPEAKKRADKTRAEEQERIWKEGAESRREAMQNKKREELEADMERIKKLPPAERQKWMEKQEKVRQRKAVKVKMVRA